MTTPLALKARLSRTWIPFFAGHGNFTPIQQQAISPILDGHNVLVISATASGKTEAAIAPLLELHCLGPNAGTPPPPSAFAAGREGDMRILYVCPTRALVRDLYERLSAPLEMLQVSLAMKSGDTGPVSIQRPPSVLITTPESTDSLLTRVPRLLADLRAVVLDEIHLLDGSPRGDHLRCLLRRIEHVRRYRSQEVDSEFTPLQYIALSATVPDPAGIVDRYLHDNTATSAGSRTAQIIEVPGERRLLAHIQAMEGLDDLVTALTWRATGTEGIRKSLVFCNTRHEVEQTAAYLRTHLPFEATVFTHYSNLDPALRLDVERDFAEAAVAFCVSTSTLELGIDIGSIDDVVLVGPPPNLSSFLQRIGRGGRRTDATRVLCLSRSPLEAVRFQGLVGMAERRKGRGGTKEIRGTEGKEKNRKFLPSVLVQQTFSILKQSPTGALRWADLRRVAPDAIDDETLHQILRHLVITHYLRRGRPGEWRPGPPLDELVDAHEIYSNIGGDPLAVQVVDAYSGRILAQIERSRFTGETLRLGGRTLAVVWRDRYRVGVRHIDGGPVEGELRFHTTPFAVPLDVSQAVASHLGLRPGQMAAVPVAEGTWLFHFWGALYGEMLGEMLGRLFAVHEDAAPVTPVNEHCLYLPGPFSHLPPWNPAEARRALHRLLPRIEPMLELGRFHALLPPEVARQAVIEQCDLPTFEHLYRNTTVVYPASGLRACLETLL